MSEPTDDLATWLLTQIEADESLARRNSDGNGLADGFPDYRTYDGPDLEAADEYISHFGPIRMLAECDSKRRIVEGLREDLGAASGAVPADEFGTRLATELKAVAVLRWLALPYSDRPGYSESWRP